MANYAQTRGFMQSLINGMIEEDMMQPFPSYGHEEREEMSAILDMVAKFCKNDINPEKIDREHCIPDSVINGMTELGLWGLIIPEEYDGFAQPEVTYFKVMEILNGACGSTTVMYGGHMSIGLKAILLFGTDEQKRRFLSELASGEKTAAFALTEAGAGSDVAGITTTAELSDDGTYYSLNGRKLWITNGGTADVFTLFAKVRQPGEDLDSAKISAFIVTRDMEGFSSGKDEDKLGLCGSSTTALYLDDVKVPVENLLGRPGDGFKIAMEVLNTGRLALGAGFVGVAKVIMEHAINFALQRRQFKRTIAEFGMIREKFARMLMNTFTAESMVYFATALKDIPGVSVAVESAICKTFNSETLWETINECLQILGGNGYMKEYPYERFLRDARVNMIFEGTNEIQRMFIVLAGFKGLSSRIRKFSEDAPLDAEMTDDRLQKIIGELISDNIVVKGFSEKLYGQIESAERLAEKLHKAALQTVLKYGKKLRDMQYLQKRFADAAIDLFGIYANIARVENLIRNLHQSADDALRIAKVFQFYAEKRIDNNLHEIESNIDDELSGLADILYSAEKYPFDIMNY